jgi:hypothetical protein
VKNKPNKTFAIVTLIISGIFCLFLGFSALRSGEAKYRSTVPFEESPFEYLVIVVIQIGVGFACFYLAYREDQK